MAKTETAEAPKKAGRRLESSGGGDGHGPGGSGGRGPGDSGGRDSGGGRGASRPPGGGGPGPLAQYKPEQGKWTRGLSLLSAGIMTAWGGKYIYDRVQVYNDPGPVGMLLSKGIPLAFVVVFGLMCYWLVYVRRTTSDFMIATEGEMKKVNWSTRREIIGSTKVVILFTALLAVLLFLFDLLFQTVFRLLGVLKTG
jgi:preprotein translocase subunit SecE